MSVYPPLNIDPADFEGAYAGDDDAVGRLIVQVERDIWSWLRKRADSDDAAQELSQKVIEKVLRSVRTGTLRNATPGGFSLMVQGHLRTVTNPRPLREVPYGPTLPKPSARTLQGDSVGSWTSTDKEDDTLDESWEAVARSLKSGKKRMRRRSRS